MKIKTLVLISAVVFVIHGVEEYFSDFYRIDNHAQLIFRFLGLSNYKTGFILLQILFWLAVIVAYFLVRANKLVTLIAVLLGTISLYELTHVWYALEIGGYYPGLYTSLAFPLLAVLLFRHALRRT